MTPREHAAAICAEPSIECRRELLEAVPAEYRAMVETHARIQFERRRAGRLSE